jgi:hypothetical protein
MIKIFKAELKKYKRTYWIYSFIAWCVWLYIMLMFMIWWDSVTQINHPFMTSVFTETFWFALKFLFPVGIWVLSYMISRIDYKNWKLLYTFNLRAKYFWAKVFATIFFLFITLFLFWIWVTFLLLLKFHWFEEASLVSILSVWTTLWIAFILYFPLIILNTLLSTFMWLWPMLLSIAMVVIIWLEFTLKTSKLSILYNNWEFIPHFYLPKMIKFFEPFEIHYEFSNIFSNYNLTVLALSSLISWIIWSIYFKKRQIKN